MRYLFFLIILLIPFGIAQAEVGKNFDTDDLGNGLIKWTSHYDRIYDGDSWENYILTDNANEIKFESAGISFSFDKANCDFKLYDPITDTIAINSYQFEIMIDGKPKPIPSCNLVDFKQNENNLSFKIDYGKFKTAYELIPSQGLEWTHEIKNTEGKASTFTITETCQDCIVESIDGNKIDFGSYTLDTKNEEHNTVKSTIESKGDYIIEYEKVIADKEILSIDPTFTSNNPVTDNYDVDTGNDDICSSGATFTLASDAATTMSVGRNSSPSADDCYRSFVEWDITSIPDSSAIQDVDFGFDVTAIVGNGPDACDYVGMNTRPSTGTATSIWTSISTDTVLLNADATCDVAGNNKSVDLGSGGDSYIFGKLSSNWAGIGIKADTEGALDGTQRYATLETENGVAVPNPTLTVVYIAVFPDRVTDLVVTDIRGAAVDLDWSQPNLNGGTLSGYQINKTTPWNPNVASIVINNTLSSTSAYTVQGLSGLTQYSFRVGVWITYPAKNMTGNVVNATTDFDPTASFTPGTINVTGSGTDLREIFYSRTDINSTALWLNVTANHTIELNCNFYYKFAMTNDTFTNIANVSISSTRDMASFKFLRVDNEIVDVLCWDQDDNQTNARYLITQLHFPLQDQIENFRNGTYGTAGQFGSFDMITIFIIIISMIGFNRVNEVVGVVLSGVTIGIMAWFGLIQWYTILTTGIAIAIFWAWSTHKSD